ncbi:sulfonate ABC transporter substrate-binding protein [Paenibacillus humicola]|uniref:sulfonate ABC transporter substrate-binding protein n=1 Tax=Paenibacillus humicola TaxID=3110540 RepID=UPI00237C36F6|nr:sulfonate ABC transporter substrate-binding protein [Paenibacillus humicola]
MKLTFKPSVLTAFLIVMAAAAVLAGCSKSTTAVNAGGAASALGNADSASAGGKSPGTKEVRIGFQKYGTMNILKARGTLEKRLSPEGYSVKWVEFPGGPQLLEALNVGSIDIGHTGEAPPIFAQAAGAPLVYLGHEPASPKSEAILVPKNSPIQTVADLKGKKIALNKGSNVHFLLVKALEKAGVKYSDIQTVFLAPGDARVAFENGSVDAWVIWDPFFAAVQTATGARVLTDGKNLVSNNEFYIASRTYAEQNKPVVDAVLDELNKVDAWAKSNQKEVAEMLSKELGIDVPSLETASERRGYGLQPINESVIQAQQNIADTFFGLKLIPQKIRIADATSKDFTK